MVAELLNPVRTAVLKGGTSYFVPPPNGTALLNDLTQPFWLLSGEKKKSKANNDYSVGHMKQARLEAAGMGDGAVNETL